MQMNFGKQVTILKDLDYLRYCQMMNDKRAAWPERLS
jgi:hypothetical protein